ncbi:MAG: ATP-binding protein, partial [bacterium]
LQHSPDLAWEPRRTTDPAAGGAGRRAGAVGGAGRLPWERTSFVGRARDTAEVVAALRGLRVLCLVGAGGVGKSRLALRAAQEAADRYADGAWWCDLAAVTAPEAVLDALAASLGVLHRTDESVESSVVDFLAGRQALLVVDNCEHVAEEAARLLGTLVDRCPQVTVLATSRTTLDVTGARTWTVEPLPVTETDDGEAEPAAVRLFIERARTIRAGLDHETADLAHIAEICRRLDGLPLAIELAAARMRSLNAADIAGRLDDRFRLLTRRSEARLARQSTLRAVVDWSFDLLSVAERRLFERLSVFAGEFTPAAAEQVCAGHPIEPGEIVDLLGRLVDASMVTVGPPQGEVSYRLLETLRAYGREHLAESGDLDRYRQAHARYYASLAEQTALGVRGPDEAAWVDRIDRDLANFREAHRWAIANVDVDVAMRLSVSLFRYAVWRLRDEVLRWAEEAVDLAGAETHALWPAACGVAGWGCGLRGQRALALRLAERGLAAAPPEDPGRITLLEVQAHVALWEGRLDDCIDVMDRAAELATDPYELMPWTVRALALAYAGRTAEALATAEHAVHRADRLGNPTMMGLARYSVAEALMERDPDAAAPVLDQVIELAGSVQNWMVLGVAGVSSAALRARHGDPAVALRSSAKVLEVWAETSDWTHLWVGLRSLAELFARVGADRAAAVLLGAVVDGSTGPPVYGADAERLAELAAALEDRLGARELAAARSRGQAMAAAEVLGFARGEIDQAAAKL